jgi:hypothetical protein
MDKEFFRASAEEAFPLLSMQNPTVIIVDTLPGESICNGLLFRRSASRKPLGAFTIQTGTTPQGISKESILVAVSKAGDKGIA